ncbi:alpha/beta hydrolase-fold protein [uncultured Tenacibaculum sp.]|uniref:alpha/beta hydrolase-fold protein n=1 Tax=uncultured Tenacibaculum sp. TaxID=174713 RepID=UPI00261EA698|nr:alpha/beta hydrolase-fold protein [uncultured Tenacibaculum sp.]
MRFFISFLFITITFCVNAQESYKSIIAKAIKERDSKSADFDKAFKLYENAFKKYPDSISQDDQYWASILAASLNKKDKAFKYLTPLAKLEKDNSGYPGWELVIGKFAKVDYQNLFNDNRWKVLKKQAEISKKALFNKLLKRENEFYKTKNTELNTHQNVKSLYKSIKNYNPYLRKKHRDYSLSFKINDSTKTSFTIHLPKNYNPNKKYPVLFFLHGAVRHTSLSEYQIPKTNLGGWNRYYTKYANKNDVILVFPKASKKYNWMTSDDGFSMVPEILKQIKTSININDNKVFVSGHSNGATGSFSYLMKQPTGFTGFYGFNTHPQVYTGGTFIENILNRSFVNFSTDQDYYYPPNANDSLNKMMKSLHADYKDYRYNGFPHWFPKFNESEPAYKILFADINNRIRNPYPKKINWEFDDNNYGNIDWLSNIKLDTLSKKATWNKQLNFKIDKWLGYNKNDSLISKKVDIKAFKFPRKSGKIIAEYDKNTFKIKTSRIASFSVNISPEMVNLKKKIKVYVNGKLLFNDKLKFDKKFMLQNFKNTNDRNQIWINSINLKI